MAVPVASRAACEGADMNDLNRSSKAETALIPCAACERQISTDAEVCPGCGNANNWVHPTLQNVIAHINRLDRVTQYEAHGHRMHLITTVQNMRQKIGTKLLTGSVALLPIGLFSSLFLTLALLLLLIGLLMIGLGLNASQTHELDLDLRTSRKVVGRYDRAFWADVMKLVRS